MLKMRVLGRAWLSGIGDGRLFQSPVPGDPRIGQMVRFCTDLTIESVIAASYNFRRHSVLCSDLGPVMKHYLAVLVPHGGWRAHFPDLPGCRAEASSVDGAILLAREAAAQRVKLLHQGT
jgi:predicted RNase H-like HicB family nuclease